MPQGNNRLISKKILAKNNKILVRTGDSIQPALFQEIMATNKKFLVRTDTGTRNSSFKKVQRLFGSITQVL